MKKNNKKKGFTIVELVIVIAVIAILAAVLIPTFSNVIEKANKSAVLQEARNVYTEVYADDIEDGVLDENKTNANAPAPYTGTYTYTTADKKLTKFQYTDGTYTASLNISTGEWTVTKTNAGG